MEAGFRLYFARICYADPQPGNFLFLPDGRLGLLDFGCCRQFDDAEWAVLMLMHDAFRRGGTAWQDGIRASLGLAPDETLSAEHECVLRAAADWMWEPLRYAGAFDFGAGDYFPRGVAALRDLVRARATRSLPVFTWVQRSLIGLRAVTCRLGARVDLSSIYERERARASA
jgi:predicted unusual protein kinase regulating ubiquinone biosynthesis (AarF/ABC1/UbiB family)